MGVKINDAVEILWTSLRQGRHYPEALRGQLTLEEAYQVQLGVLARCIDTGERQAGWKIGLSAESIRAMYGVNTPVFGYLLASRHFLYGQTFRMDDIINPAIESELCITLGKRLTGPGVTRTQVLDAVQKIAPAFEVVALRGNMAADLPLGIADNVAQWAYVTGTEIEPYPKDLDLGEITVTIHKNGVLEAQEHGAEVIDNQLDSLAWLANTLAQYGRSLDTGQCVMTGSFTKPLPLKKGERWETRFSAVGSIATSFE